MARRCCSYPIYGFPYQRKVLPRQSRKSFNNKVVENVSVSCALNLSGTSVPQLTTGQRVVGPLTSSDTEARPHCGSCAYTNSAISVYIISPVHCGRLVATSKHHSKHRPQIHSRSCIPSQLSFPIYCIYVQLSVISDSFREHTRRAPSGSKCWQRHCMGHG